MSAFSNRGYQLPRLKREKSTIHFDGGGCTEVARGHAHGPGTLRGSGTPNDGEVKKKGSGLGDRDWPRWKRFETQIASGGYSRSLSSATPHNELRPESSFCCPPPPPTFADPLFNNRPANCIPGQTLVRKQTQAMKAR
ncbi:hypothetical protein CEXT_252611 [Caerostris extrusa]|uniref:Uncharacterized protein n=1 Tax=Caerostris extrusa TaxID=172846 RepID=A0AAV4MZP0_CAEEX|nr:hypothetical protein CEXT_252611 [Caerostris extrusa]